MRIPDRKIQDGPSPTLLSTTMECPRGFQQRRISTQHLRIWKRILCLTGHRRQNLNP